MTQTLESVLWRRGGSDARHETVSRCAASAARSGVLARRSTVRTIVPNVRRQSALLRLARRKCCLVNQNRRARRCRGSAVVSGCRCAGGLRRAGHLDPGTPAPQARSRTTDPALFQVGTSVVDITPKTAMADGGYGSNYIVSGGAHDPLQVRAFFIGHGKHAVVFESVDSQGWFAAYQAPNAGDGADDARREAAADLAALGYDVTPADIVESATHDHAAPTLMGIWGHTDPGYLHAGQGGRRPGSPRGTVKRPPGGAVVCDRHHSRPALSGPGNRPDGRVRRRRSAADPVGPRAGHWRDDRHVRQRAGPRRSVRPDRGRATTSGAPTTPDTRARVCPQLFGGTEVLAQGTLGRQETIGADPSYNEVVKQGTFVTNAIVRALAHAHRITDTTLKADNVSFTTAAQNTGLLAAMSCNHPGGPLGCPGPLSEPASNGGAGTWDWTAVGNIFTVNRSLQAPVLQCQRRQPDHRHVDDRRPGRGSDLRDGPGRGVRRGHGGDRALVRRVAGHRRRAHHRPRERPARLLLGPAARRLPGRADRPERLRPVQRRLAAGPGQRGRGSPGRRRPRTESERSAGVRAGHQPQRVLATDDRVLPGSGRDRRPGGELLRHRQERAGARRPVDVDRVDGGPPRATARSAGTSATAPPRPNPSRRASRTHSRDRAATR